LASGKTEGFHSARKIHSTMLFKDIIGQQKVKNRLIKSVHEERISHAQLFSGPEGNGKIALALAYAQYITCRNRSETDSCGVCPPCKNIPNLPTPTSILYFPYLNPNRYKSVYSDDFLKQWREMLLKSPYIS
jgi:DNA polymerase III subunit delta'